MEREHKRAEKEAARGQARGSGSKGRGKSRVSTRSQTRSTQPATASTSLIALMDLTMSLMTVSSVLTVVKVTRLDFGFSVTVCHGIMLSVLIIIDPEEYMIWMLLLGFVIVANKHFVNVKLLIWCNINVFNAY